MSVAGVNGPSAAAGLQMELLLQALTQELDQGQPAAGAQGSAQPGSTAPGAPALPAAPTTPAAPLATGLPATEAAANIAWPSEPTAHQTAQQVTNQPTVQAAMQAQAGEGSSEARPAADRLRRDERIGLSSPPAAAAPASALAGGATPEPGAAAQMVPLILAALQPGQVPPALQRSLAEEQPASRQRRQREQGGDDGEGEGSRAPAGEDALFDAEPRAGFRPHQPLPDPLPAASRGAATQHWCEPLIQALMQQAHQREAQPALQWAAQQWLQGRCVVLACPQAVATPANGWAFVLWRGAGSGGGAGLALQGRRFAARLRWAQPSRWQAPGPSAASHNHAGGSAARPQPPAAGAWWAVRTVKDHQVARGRQLCTLADVHVPTRAASPRLVGVMSCEVQLGPVRPSVVRWQDLCIQIDAAHGFWLALGAQWTVPVLATSAALLPDLPDLSDLHHPMPSSPNRLGH